MGVWANVKWIFGWPSRLYRLLVRRVDVLVVGSAHIDTTGEVKDTHSFAKGTDHDGTITYSVGGSGYNVAVNLAAAGSNRHVALDTLLPKESRLADLVMSKLALNSVSLDYVRRPSVKDASIQGIETIQGLAKEVIGGRVEVRARDERIFSVSRTLVDTPHFLARNRDKIAVERAKALVLDTYLLESAARDVVGRALKKGTPIFVLVSTDSTARRFARGIVAGAFFAEGAVLCIAGAARVIEAMMLEVDPNEDRHVERIRVVRGQAKAIDPDAARAICGLLKSRYVACIYDLKATVLAETGEHLRIDMSGFPVTNQKGDGDALMAAIVDVFLSEGGRSVSPARAQTVLNLSERRVAEALKFEIGRHVRRAVSSHGSTLGSVISFEEPFDTWARLIDRQLKYWGMQGLNAVVWLGVAYLVNRLAIWAGMEDFLRVPVKKLTALLGILAQWLKTVLVLIFGH